MGTLDNKTLMNLYTMCIWYTWNTSRQLKMRLRYGHEALIHCLKLILWVGDGFTLDWNINVPYLPSLFKWFCINATKDIQHWFFSFHLFVKCLEHFYAGPNLAIEILQISASKVCKTKTGIQGGLTHCGRHTLKLLYFPQLFGGDIVI